MAEIDYIMTGKGNSEKNYQITRENTTDYWPIIDRVQGRKGTDLLLQEVPQETIEYIRVMKVLNRGVLNQKGNGRRLTFEDISAKLD